MIIAAILAISGPLVGGAPPLPVQVIQSFKTLCADGAPSAKTVLRLAEAEGWRSEGPGLPKDFDPATDRFKVTPQGVLRLKVNTNESAGEHRDVCGVSVFGPADGLVKMTQNWLGFQPSFEAGTSATFYALRQSNGWVSGAHLDGPRFSRAKAEGAFSTIMVLGGKDITTLLLLRVSD